jgi:hypothetical protein
MILTAIRRPSGGTRTERLAELANTASYRTVLALAALSLIDVGDGGSGVGWGRVLGVGVTCSTCTRRWSPTAFATAQCMILRRVAEAGVDLSIHDRLLSGLGGP